MDNTVWKNEESKWKPRNFQAAKVMFPAHGLNLPPSEPVFAEPEAERLAKERAERDKRIAAQSIENAAKEQASKAKQEELRKKQFEKKMRRYKAKQLRGIAKAQNRAAHPWPTLYKAQ